MNDVRNEVQYTEWVLPNWTSFLPILAIYPTLWLTFLPINVSAGAWSGVILSVVVAALMIAKSARVTIDVDELYVANARIERRFIVAADVVSADEGFAARGRDLDPGAWIHFQGSVKTLVRVWIQDPSDPTPYWLFSTRNPEKIKAILGF